MKLRQGQTWKLSECYVRIARLERLSVEYKVINDLVTKQGEHHKATKKNFCRLIKSGKLLTPQEVAEARDINSEVIRLPESDLSNQISAPLNQEL